MKALVWAALWCAAGAWAAERPEESTAERDRVVGVVNAIEHKDCQRAVSRLNDGLAARYPGAFVLAGSMYDEGICLKANWERAQHMYLAAHEAGHGAGLLRLVAGHAHQQRDRAAALWWALQSPGLDMPEPCRVPERLWQDAELFVATLRLWPAGRLSACAYAVGVLAAVAGEVQYPSVALDHSLTGKVAMRFVPAAGLFEWRTTELETLELTGVSSGDTLREQSSRRVQDSLQNYLRGVGTQALSRYERPAGVPADWQLNMTYVFSIR